MSSDSGQAPGGNLDTTGCTQPDGEPRVVCGGRFLLEERLGVGGSGTVYRAVDRITGDRVALKMAHDRANGFAKTRDRFEQEAALARLVGHPNVPLPIELFDHHGPPALSFELAPGRSAAQLLATSRTFSGERAIHCVSRLLDVLAAVHDAGVVHRDVKPGNVLIGRDDRVWLIDFGIAVRPAACAAGSRAPCAFGSPGFMPPEQWVDAHAVDHRADIFGAGATLHALLTGRPPGSDRWEGGKDLRHVAGDLSEVIGRACAPRTEDRYASAGEMARALLQCAPPRRVVHAPAEREAPTLVPGGSTWTAHLAATR